MDGNNVFSPLLTQIRTAYITVDCGMSYVLRLPDGCFFIVDGGIGEYEEPEHLLDVLRAQSPFEKPVVAAWLFTHPHGDHFFCFEKIMTKYPDQLEVRCLMYTWPDYEKTPVQSDHSLFDRIAASFPEKSVLHPVRGDVFSYAGAVMKMLFTHEDIPAPIDYVNNASMIFSVEVSGRRILFLGDCCDIEAEALCEVYRHTDELKCDILQVAHHGYWGGCDELYRLNDPKILLWPCPTYRSDVIDWDCNRALREGSRFERLYLAGRDEYTFDLSLPDELAFPEPEYTDQVYAPVLTEGSVFDLQMRSVYGGGTGYTSADITVGEEGSTFTLPEGSHGVLELVMPGQVPTAAGFEWTMEGMLHRGSIALMPDTLLPVKWNEEEQIPLPVSGPFKLTFEADPDAGIGTLTLNGQKSLHPLVLRQDRGLYLALEDASVTLSALKVTARR